MDSVEQAMQQYVLLQGVGDTTQLSEDLQVLREQLSIVYEYVIAKRKRLHVAVESAFGESFEEKKERLRDTSSHVAALQSTDWDCVALIVKSNDDLRQEVLCQQIIRQLQDIFHSADLPLRLLPYEIIATSASTGMIEYVKNAVSLDALKKRGNYTTLADHFLKTYGQTDSAAYKTAMTNFVRSMAAYSLACYFLQIKDRHNGNIMIDSDGHVIHIDFGFILGIAPGGRFSLETAPFKLTGEMVDAMGGTQSDYFKAYVIFLIQGFLALQQHADTILMMIAIMAQQSSCPCFLSQNPRDVLSATKQLFRLDYNQSQVIKHVISLVRRSHSSYRTRQYDVFQRMTNGILP
uniref:1-phosphatidylinositol 4-kinase n=1 Tax=Hyaloperonospora arabidopsidis (strain Emoy2) TaxID=559515 RepID=M4BH19_HYAAE